MNLLLKVNSRLPFGLTVHRVVQLIVGIVFLISGLGSTTFWVFKYAGNQVFVPFGLSTYRALNWPMSDFVLIFCCLYAAATTITDSPRASRGCIVGGAAFVAQGLLGFLVDSSQVYREQFGVETIELQPMVLNLWFVGWGAFSIWIGAFGLNMLAKIHSQSF